MWLCSVPLLVPTAHLLDVFAYGNSSARRSLLIDFFVAAFVVGIWIGVREWWHEKDVPRVAVKNTTP